MAKLIKLEPGEVVHIEIPGWFADSSAPKIICQVCCKYFGRHRIIYLLEDRRFCVCESNFREEFPCGFSFSDRMSNDEIRIEADRHIERLKARVND
ncbi:MAG: hypothetical protein G01um101430_553 [Parcubacteria group bacterium Gr01-1014_30]|nr:MAG: hypothetical protein G01um101430_553 [Parcubacteria group bacterium Gr01-1014_30]